MSYTLRMKVLLAFLFSLFFVFASSFQVLGMDGEAALSESSVDGGELASVTPGEGEETPATVRKTKPEKTKSGKKKSGKRTLQSAGKISITGGKAGYEQLQDVLFSGGLAPGTEVCLTEDVIMTTRETYGEEPCPEYTEDDEDIYHRWVECRCEGITINGNGHAILCEDAVKLKSRKVFCVKADHVTVKNLAIRVKHWGPDAEGTNMGLYCLCFDGAGDGRVKSLTTSGENNGLFLTHGARVTVEDCRFEKGSHSGIYLTGKKDAPSVATVSGSLVIRDIGDDFMPVHAGIDVCDGSRVMFQAQSAQLRPGEEASGIRVCEGCRVTGHLNADIRGARIGIVNRGTVEDFTGFISGSTLRGVHQEGSFGMSGEAEVAAGSSNRIFLAEGRVVKVVGALHGGSRRAGFIRTASDDREIGRRVAVVSYDPSKAPGMQSDQRLREGTAAFMVDPCDYASGLTTEEGRVKKPVVLRAGTGANGKEGDILLSARFDAAYRPNLKGLPKTVKLTMPEDETFYWREDRTFHTSRRPTAAYRGHDVSKSLICTGYKCIMTSPREGYHGVTYGEDAAFCGRVLTGDITFNAQWTVKADLEFCGNEATEGEDYVLENRGPGDPLPFNAAPDSEDLFRKSEDYFRRADYYSAAKNREGKLRYNENRDSYLAFYDVYGFAGWCLRPDARTGDPDVLEPGKPLAINGRDQEVILERVKAYLTYIDELIEGERAAAPGNPGSPIYFRDPGKVTLKLFVVWDQAPVIRAFDRAFSQREAIRKQITEERLLEGVSAEDREDGPLKKKQLSVVDFDPGDFQDLGEAGSAEVVYAARDSLGNVSYERVLVYIQTDEPMTSRMTEEDGAQAAGGSRPLPNYLRFVSKTYYEGGSMEPYSVWVLLADYRDVITAALENLESGTYVQSYSYGRDAIREGSAYVEEHAHEVSDASYRREFYRQICHDNAR